MLQNYKFVILTLTQSKYMKLLITGATGFLGHHLIEKLKRTNPEDTIRIFKTKEDDMKLLPNFRGEIVEGDIRNADEVDEAVASCDVVFHLVGMVSYWDKLNDLQTQINVGGTKNVVDACLKHKVQRLVYVSSNVAIGYPPKGQISDEGTPYNFGPLRINYCETKYRAEIEIHKGIEKGLNAVIICPASMYGTGDIRRIHSDLMFKFSWPFNLIYLDGGLAVVDVEDVANGMILAWQKGKTGQRYLMVSENLTQQEIRNVVAKALGKEEPKIKIPNWFLAVLANIFVFISLFNKKKPKLTPAMAKFFQLYLNYSNEKARRELGMQFIPFKKSIEKQVAWYRANGYL